MTQVCGHYEKHDRCDSIGTGERMCVCGCCDPGDFPEPTVNVPGYGWRNL